jgi:hypothetical protein
MKYCHKGKPTQQDPEQIKGLPQNPVGREDRSYKILRLKTIELAFIFLRSNRIENAFNSTPGSRPRPRQYHHNINDLARGGENPD